MDLYTFNCLATSIESKYILLFVKLNIEYVKLRFISIKLVILLNISNLVIHQGTILFFLIIIKG